ncbi:MAG: hypothetical protein WC111_01565, partial [Candidatus Cloacimonadaceae bacterium]
LSKSGYHRRLRKPAFSKVQVFKYWSAGFLGFGFLGFGVLGFGFPWFWGSWFWSLHENCSEDIKHPRDG